MWTWSCPTSNCRTPTDARPDPNAASGSLTAIDAEPVLEPGRGKTKTGRFWRHAVDDRPWTESSHPGAAYSEDRRGEDCFRSFDHLLVLFPHAGPADRSPVYAPRIAGAEKAA